MATVKAVVKYEVYHTVQVDVPEGLGEAEVLEFAKLEALEEFLPSYVLFQDNEFELGEAVSMTIEVGTDIEYYDL